MIPPECIECPCGCGSDQTNCKKEKVECPFCSGSKVKPFVGATSQDCKECDKDGFISKAKLERCGII